MALRWYTKFRNFVSDHRTPGQKVNDELLLIQAAFGTIEEEVSGDTTIGIGVNMIFGSGELTWTFPSIEGAVRDVTIKNTGIQTQTLITPDAATFEGVHDGALLLGGDSYRLGPDVVNKTWWLV